MVAAGCVVAAAAGPLRAVRPRRVRVMVKLALVVIWFAAWALVVWAIIRADERAEREYQDWYEHPDRVWNQ